MGGSTSQMPAALSGNGRSFPRAACRRWSGERCRRPRPPESAMILPWSWSALMGRRSSSPAMCRTCPSRSLESRFGVNVKRITAEEFREPLALCGAEPGPRRVGQQGPGMGVVESFSAACRSKGRRWAAFGLADRDPSQLGFVGQPTADRCRVRGSFAARFARPLSAHDESQRFGVRFLGVWDTVSSVGWILGPGEVLYTA